MFAPRNLDDFYLFGVPDSIIREKIMYMAEPFCVQDLLSRFKKMGISEEGRILKIFDRMYAEGLLEYKRVEGSSSGFAFVSKMVSI